MLSQKKGAADLWGKWGVPSEFCSIGWGELLRHPQAVRSLFISSCPLAIAHAPTRGRGLGNFAIWNGALTRGPSFAVSQDTGLSCVVYVDACLSCGVYVDACPSQGLKRRQKLFVIGNLLSIDA